MANKKIAFIITKLELGGAQKSVLYSVRNLNRPPLKTYLLCGKGGFLDKTAKKNIKSLFFIPDMVREISLLKDIKAFFQIRKRLANIRPDIVHTNSSKAGILGRLAAASLIKRPKIIHTVHGFSFYEGQKPTQKYFYILAEKLLAELTDCLIFVSREDMDNALRLKIAKASKCRLIRAGVEVKRRADFKDLDKEATAFLEKYYPEALEEPLRVPIEDIAKEKLGLNVIQGYRITDDFTIFGQICFSQCLCQLV